MATPKEMPNMAWLREFDVADQETNLRVQRIERARRAALHRSCALIACGATSMQPAASNVREPASFAAQVPSMTRHGQTRLRQRGITVDQVMTVIDYGTEQRAHGASRYFLDRQARTRIAVQMPQVLRSLASLDIHVVLADDGRLITASHRTKRIRRDISKTLRPCTND